MLDLLSVLPTDLKDDIINCSQQKTGVFILFTQNKSGLKLIYKIIECVKKKLYLTLRWPMVNHILPTSFLVKVVIANDEIDSLVRK